MMDKKAWVLAILAIFGLTACATMQSVPKAPPLPNDINIIPPSPDLPQDIAALSGKWVGTWNDGTETILVVEEIHDTWAQTLYSVGDNIKFNISAGYFRIRSKVISDPKPKILVPFARNDLYLEMKDLNTLEGSLRGSSEEQPWRSTVRLKRAN